MRVLRDRLDHGVDVLVGNEALERAVELVGADVDDADAIVRVQHGDGVVRADLGPVRERVHTAGEQRMQQQRGQREVIDAVHLRGDLHLLLVVRVHLDEDLESALGALLAQTGDQSEGLGCHEAARAGLFCAITDGIEANVLDVRCAHPVEDRHQVRPAFGGVGVDVHLLRRERDPHQARLAGEGVVGERQARARAVDPGELLFGRTVREDRAHRQEHRVILGLFAVLEHILELARLPAHVVDDRVDHDVVCLGELGDVIPITEARVDFRVVDGVEASVGAVERREERQDMHAFIHAGETGAQDVGQGCEIAIAHSVRIGDELHFVLHEFLLVESVMVDQSRRWD